MMMSAPRLFICLTPCPTLNKRHIPFINDFLARRHGQQTAIVRAARHAAVQDTTCFSTQWRGRVGVCYHQSSMSKAIEKNNAERLKQKLLRATGRAIKDFNMIEDGDRVMVCLSGGKDSYTLLELLLDLQRRAPVRFELLAVHLDQAQPGYEAHAQVLPEYLRAAGVPHQILRKDTYSVVKRLVPEG